jgi:GNAT superfamily N-acetyltransferase
MRDAPERTRGYVRFRRATPTDAAAVCSMVLRCSATSLYGRFLTVVALDTAASRLVDGLASDTAHSWLAEVGRDVVGIGTTYMFANGAAEIALLVEDRWQGRGIATGLLPDLVEEARVRDAPLIWATALGERMPTIRSLAKRVGGSIQVTVSAGIAEITAELPAPRPHERREHAALYATGRP